MSVMRATGPMTPGVSEWNLQVSGLRLTLKGPYRLPPPVKDITISGTYNDITLHG